MRWTLQVAGAVAHEKLRNGDPVLDHDVDWLVAQCDRPDKKVLVAGDGAGRHVPFFVHDGQIDFDLGEFSIGSSRIRRHVLVGNFGDAIGADEWVELFEALRRAANSRDAWFLLGVVVGEPLEAALASPRLRRHFRVVPHGPAYPRRLCTLRGGLDEYLASLPAGRRQDLRRSLRRFESEFDGRWRLEVAADEAAVGRFLDDIAPVSERGYQARLRGLGISRTGHVGTKALEGARRGYVRCYLLRIDERPVAWRIGFLYGGTYYSHHIGYDDAFQKWHPGVVVHLHSVRDLSAPERGAQRIDLLYGDNDFKRKASDASREERNYYVFPRNLRGTANALALSTINGVSAQLGRALHDLGWKQRIARWLRRGAAG